MEFGPQWLRNIADGGASGQTQSGAGGGGTNNFPGGSHDGGWGSSGGMVGGGGGGGGNFCPPVTRYKLAEHRYGREEMLGLFESSPELSVDIKENIQEMSIFVVKPQLPLLLQPPSDEEQALLLQSVNSEISLQGRGGNSGGGRSGGGPSGQSYIRGGSRGRGENDYGRGRGYVPRGYDDDYRNTRAKEPWDDRGMRGGGSGSGFGPSSQSGGGVPGYDDKLDGPPPPSSSSSGSVYSRSMSTENWRGAKPNPPPVGPHDNEDIEGSDYKKGPSKDRWGGVRNWREPPFERQVESDENFSRGHGGGGGGGKFNRDDRGGSGRFDTEYSREARAGGGGYHGGPPPPGGEDHRGHVDFKRSVSLGQASQPDDDNHQGGLQGGSRGCLPEWSELDANDVDANGTFDVSGAFLASREKVVRKLETLPLRVTATPPSSRPPQSKNTASADSNRSGGAWANNRNRSTNPSTNSSDSSTPPSHLNDNTAPLRKGEGVNNETRRGAGVDPPPSRSDVVQDSSGAAVRQDNGSAHDRDPAIIKHGTVTGSSSGNTSGVTAGSDAGPWRSTGATSGNTTSGNTRGNNAAVGNAGFTAGVFTGGATTRNHVNNEPSLSGGAKTETVAKNAGVKPAGELVNSQTGVSTSVGVVVGHSAPSTRPEETLMWGAPRGSGGLCSEKGASEEGGAVPPTGGPVFVDPVDDQWYYLDPQQQVQGPFSNGDMNDWLQLGFFTMSLEVRAGPSMQFMPLGELIKAIGRHPFQTRQPDTVTQQQQQQQPLPVHRLSPNILAGSPQTSDNVASQQLRTYQQQQQQLLVAAQAAQAAQQQQQLYQQELYRQQMHFMRQQQQQGSVITRPSLDLPSPSTGGASFLPSSHLPSSNSYPLLAGAGGASNILPSPSAPSDAFNKLFQGAAVADIKPGEGPLGSLGFAGGLMSGRPIATQQTVSSVWDIEVPKLTVEQLESMPYNMAPSSATNNDSLVGRRALEEETKRLEKLRLHEQTEQKRKEHEQERVTQEQKQREQEQRVREEHMRSLEAERRRLEVEAREREMAHQREAAARAAAEAAREEERKREREGRAAQDRKREREEEEKRREKARTEEAEARALKQRKLEETLKRQEELARKEAAQILAEEQAKQAAARPCAWSNGPSSSGGPKLSEIQRETAEREAAQRRDEGLREMEQQRQQLASIQQQKQQHWSQRTAAPPVQTQSATSLLDIQIEQALTEGSGAGRQQTTYASKTTDYPIISSGGGGGGGVSLGGGGGIWGAGSSSKKGGSSWNADNFTVPQNQPPNKPVGIWDTPASDNNNASATRNNAQFPALDAANKKTMTTLSKSKKPASTASSVAQTKTKKEEAQVQQLFKATVVKDEFTQWCESALHGLKTSVDIPTLVDFLKDIESPHEVSDYISSYLGESKQTREFAQQFLERRSKLKNAAKPKVQDSISWPTTAINPLADTTSASSQQGGSAGKGKGGGTGGGLGGGGAQQNKKKKKMQKLDSSILGFTVHADPQRTNVGEIDSVVVGGAPSK